jgi:hypothetical protein
MRYPHQGWWSLFVVLYLVLGHSAAFAAQTLRCESEGFTYKRCPADTDRGVRIVEQLSVATCRPGETWGYDRQGIWVDNGCAAAFVIGSRVTREDDSGHPPASPGRIIRCKSEEFTYNRCPTDVGGEVQLVRQLSRADCRQGETWG